MCVLESEIQTKVQACVDRCPGLSSSSLHRKSAPTSRGSPAPLEKGSELGDPNRGDPSPLESLSEGGFALSTHLLCRIKWFGKKGENSCCGKEPQQSRAACDRQLSRFRSVPGAGGLQDTCIRQKDGRLGDGDAAEQQRYRHRHVDPANSEVPLKSRKPAHLGVGLQPREPVWNQKPSDGKRTVAQLCKFRGWSDPFGIIDRIFHFIYLDSGSEIKSYLVRLLTYLPGRPIAEIPISPQLLYEIGKLAANLDKTLEKFHHPKLSSLHRENFIWNLKNVPLLEKYLYALGQNRNREIVEEVIQLFKEEVMSKLSHFRECINHGDLNDHNILMESRKSASGDAEYQVSGILDFDDMSYGYYVFEVAITIMYMMIESKSSIQVGGHVLAGFESVIPLTAVERSALFLLVCSRFCQSLVMAAYSCQLYPENKDYLMVTAKTGWKHLQRMLDMGQKAVETIWFETAKSYESGICM
uniref:Hydroxylysine kinase n=1 Tax=Saimiri boliviensis boliviensis TaxID=39432 RepID=A0A2K6TVM6_SAIBB